MASFKIITSESLSSREEGSIAINTSISGNPILEYYKSGSWVALDNLGSTGRMARLDDLYTQLYQRNWGIGPILSERSGDLYLHTELQDSQIPKLNGGIKISEHPTSDEVTDDMNKEIDIYYNSLVSARDFLEGSSVVDLWEYPTEYGGILNLVTLPSKTSTPTINVCVAWVFNGVRKSENFTFIPWKCESGEIIWSEFQSPLGEDEVTLEFHDGCIRIFPGRPEVTECIIHHCSATYDGLL